MFRISSQPFQAGRSGQGQGHIRAEDLSLGKEGPSQARQQESCPNIRYTILEAPALEAVGTASATDNETSLAMSREHKLRSHPLECANNHLKDGGKGWPLGDGTPHASLESIQTHPLHDPIVVRLALVPHQKECQSVILRLIWGRPPVTYPTPNVACLKSIKCLPAFLRLSLFSPRSSGLHSQWCVFIPVAASSCLGILPSLPSAKAVRLRASRLRDRAARCQ